MDWSRRALALSLALVALPCVVWAMRAGPEPPFEVQLRNADLVVHAAVESADAAWSEDRWGRHIWTTYHLRVHESLKGGSFPGDLVRLRLMGGTVGDITETVFDVQRPVLHCDAVYLMRTDETGAPISIVSVVPVAGKTVRYQGRPVALADFMSGLRTVLEVPSQTLQGAIAVLQAPTAEIRPATPEMQTELKARAADASARGPQPPRVFAVPPLAGESRSIRPPTELLGHTPSSPTALTATIADAWWAGAVDHDGDGYAQAASLWWDPNVAGGSGSLTVVEDVYYRPAGGTDWILIGSTAPHVITDAGSGDAQSMAIVASGAPTAWEFAIAIRRSGESAHDDVRLPSNDSDLANVLLEGASYDEVLTATIAATLWTNVVDEDQDGYARLAQLGWDPDVVGGEGALTVFEKIYARPSGSATWSLLVTVPPHPIFGAITADAVFMNVGALPHNAYEWRIELYRDGMATPDDVRDSSNDGNLANTTFETAEEDTPPQPVISSITPSKAAAGIGAQITILGSNFGSVPGSVEFLFKQTLLGSQTVSGSIVSWSDTQIVSTVPICASDECGGYPGGAASGPLWVVSGLGVESSPFPFEVSFSFADQQWASPVNYRIGTSVPSDFLTPIQSAFSTWSAASGFEAAYGGATSSTSTGQNGVTEILYGAVPPDNETTIAYASCWPSTSTPITECDIIFNQAKPFSTATPTPLGYFDVESIALHEFGHWLVLNDLYGNVPGFPLDVDKVMYGLGSTGPEGMKRDLHPDDIAGAQWIYGPAVPCSYSLSPTSAHFPAGGGTGSVAVSTAADCSWSATSNASWVVVTGGPSGTGNGTVSFAVAANTGSARSATLSIGGQTFTVTQDPDAGCSYSLSQSSASFPAAGGSGSVVVTTTADCPWSASSTVTWLTVTSGQSGTGTATVSFTVEANAGSSRQADLIIAGQTFTVTQEAGAGCSYSLSPTTASFPASGGSGTANVTTTPTCSWGAATSAAWVTITGGQSGTGSGTVSYSVAANPGVIRSATLLIAGHTLTITQEGATACVAPAITLQPESVTIAPNRSTTLWAGATGSPPIAFQWYRGQSGDTANPVAGANSTAFTTPVLTATTSYWIRASNACGSANSITATVTVSSGGTAHSYVVPGIAHWPGANSTAWRTDLALVNRSGSSGSVTVSYSSVVDGMSGNQTFSVQSGAELAWRDVLVSLFGLAADGQNKGVVRVSSTVPLAIVARTFNETPDGTYGQALPAVNVARTITTGQVAILPSLANNALFRTNVGVTNVGAEPCSVRVQFYDHTGTPLGSPLTLTAGPGSYTQRDNALAAAGAGTADNAYATVEVTTSGGRAWVFASVVDNASGDPTTIEMIVP